MTLNYIIIILLFYFILFFLLIARSIPVGLGLGFGIGVTVASIKYMHGTYFPPLPPRGATLQEPYPPTIK